MKKLSNDAIIEGRRLAYNAATQRKYVRVLTHLVQRMTKALTREVIKLFDSKPAEEFRAKQEKAAGVAMDADIASQARIVMNKLTNRFELLFNRQAKNLVEKMIWDTNKSSAKSLDRSLKVISKNITIKTSDISGALRTIIKASVNENVDLIKSIGQNYLSDIKKTVMRSIINGDGLKTIIPELEKREGITHRHARNIALDQTRKVYNSMNKSRMEAVGVKEFKWIHSGGGQRPRQDHINMNGNIYSFADPPVIVPKTGERGIPGQAINCTCTMVPIVKFNTGSEE